MSKSSRKNRTRTVGTPPASQAPIAAAIAALPTGVAATPPALTLVDSGSSSETAEQTEEAKTPIRLVDKYEQITVESMRELITRLGNEPDVVKGGLYNKLPGSMSHRLRTFALHNMPLHMAFLQQLSAIRRHSADWQVVDVSFYDEVVDEVWFEKAKTAVDKWSQLIEDVRLGKERVAELEQALDAVKQLAAIKSDAPVPIAVASETSAALMAQIAGLVEEVTQLRSEVSDQITTIAALERQLTEPPTVTDEHVAAYLASFLTKKS